jgi:hypothetical protein
VVRFGAAVVRKLNYYITTNARAKHHRCAPLRAPIYRPCAAQPLLLLRTFAAQPSDLQTFDIYSLNLKRTCEFFEPFNLRAQLRSK